MLAKNTAARAAKQELLMVGLREGNKIMECVIMMMRKEGSLDAKKSTSEQEDQAEGKR